MKTYIAFTAPAPPRVFLKFLLRRAAAAVWAMPGEVNATLGSCPIQSKQLANRLVKMENLDA